MKLDNGKNYEVVDLDEVSGALTLFIFDRIDLYDKGVEVTFPHFWEWVCDQPREATHLSYSGSMDGLTQGWESISPEEAYKENSHYYIKDYLNKIL